MHLFLDFDGVLRRLSSDPTRLEPQCLEQFELAIRPIDDLKLVISSTWRMVMSLDELRELFPEPVAERIVGVTPVLVEHEPHARYREILRYLQTLQVTERWLAIDDDPDHFPHGAPTLITDPYRGFDAGCVARLWEHLLTE